MMKKLTVLILAGLAFAPAGGVAQTKSDDKAREAAILKVDKATLKKAVRERSNGDVMVGKMKLIVKHYPNLPPYIDSYLLHFFPSLDMQVLDEKIGEWKKKNEAKNPVLTGMFSALNSAMVRQNVRIKQMGTGETNLKQRINSGIPLYWAAHVNYEFMAFMRDRVQERDKVRDKTEWKKMLIKRQYNAELREDYRNTLYFFILGYNTQSGEFAVSSSPEEDMLIWVTPAEIRKYTYMIWEPTL